MKFEIELIDIGRDKYCKKLTMNADNLEECIDLVYDNEVRTHLFSQNVSMSPKKGTDGTEWIVFAGFYTVGTVKIKPIPLEII